MTGGRVWNRGQEPRLASNENAYVDIVHEPSNIGGVAMRFPSVVFVRKMERQLERDGKADEDDNQGDGVPRAQWGWHPAAG